MSERELRYDELVISVEDGDRSRVTVWPDGRQAFEAKVTLTEAGIEMLKEGYLCGHCLQDLRPVGAFPERCPLCGFRVRELQSTQLARDFIGEEQLGSRLSLSDELTRLGEMWTPEDGI